MPDTPHLPQWYVTFGTTPAPLVKEVRYRSESTLGRVEVTSAESTSVTYIDDLPETPVSRVDVMGFMPSGTPLAPYSWDVNPRAAQALFIQWEGGAATPTAKKKTTGTYTLENIEWGAARRAGQEYTCRFVLNTGPGTHAATT